MNMLDDVDFQIARLSLGEDDVLVVRVDRPITAIVQTELRAQLERKLGAGRRVLVIDSTVELSVVDRKIAKRFAAQSAA